MKNVIGFTVGRLSRAGQIVNPQQGGKPFLAFTLELDEVAYGDKKFRPKVECKCYQRDMDALVSQLSIGTLVSMQGEVRGEKREYQGKTYVNTTITGQCSVIEALRSTQGLANEVSKANESPAARFQTKAPALPKDDDDDDEKLPF